MFKKKKPVRKAEDRFCYFCVNNFKEIDYKKTEAIGKFVSNYGKILPRERMGTCARHQRKLAQAVKRARYMALLPYVK
ncbi:MAG: 30S ribosomal protein S18 [Patescibacteria group bacterium]|jgi:small subunit ribosomal protein S18